MRRCRPGMRSATATYSRLEAATASANGSSRTRGFEREEPHHAADDRRQAGEQVQRQRTAARHARMKQHGEVADFLRNLVRHDGERGHDAEVHVGQEGRRDQHAVEHVVQGIADQHQRTARLAARVIVLTCE